MMTTEQYEAMVDQIHDYSRTHLGCKFGDDFPEIARVLMMSEKFKSFVMAAGLTGSMGSMGLRELRDKYPEGSEAFKDAAMEHLSQGVREFLAEAFYTGYRLGLADKEVIELRRMEREIR
jgi:hypothetical protein